MNTFEELEINEDVMRSIKELGFTTPFPIQAQAIPELLRGNDVIGQAHTGTGKTIAFLSAVFHHLLENPAAEGRKQNQPRAIIMAPTRELAVQIHNAAVSMAQACNLSMGLVYGGEGYESQRQQLEAGVDVLIGTTGRIIDYFKQGIDDLKNVYFSLTNDTVFTRNTGQIARTWSYYDTAPLRKTIQSKLATLSYNGKTPIPMRFER